MIQSKIDELLDVKQVLLRMAQQVPAIYLVMFCYFVYASLVYTFSKFCFTLRMVCFCSMVLKQRYIAQLLLHWISDLNFAYIPVYNIIHYKNGPKSLCTVKYAQQYRTVDNGSMKYKESIESACL